VESMSCERERGGERSHRRSPASSEAGAQAGDTRPDYNAIFDAYGLSPLNEHDRIEAARIWMSQETGPPDEAGPAESGWRRRSWQFPAAILTTMTLR
jgi:hypothetical protein